MEVLNLDRIHELVDTITERQSRKYQDYADMREMYLEYLDLNQLLIASLKQYNPSISNKFLNEHHMLKQDPVLIKPIDLGNIIDECIVHNNALLESIDMQDTRLSEFERYRYTPVKDVDTVEVLQLCYENVCMCLQMKDKGISIPADAIYEGMKINEMSVPDLAQLYIGVKEANDKLNMLLTEG